MSSDSENDIEINNLDDENILNKYKMAAEIVHKIVRELMTKCVAGSNISDLCIHGDARVNEESSKIFKKEKEMKKGLSFPTSISRNNVVSNFSPIISAESVDDVIEDGDLLKIDVGAHIDGYAAVIGHSFVIGASKDNKITGRKADAILAAYNCAEVSLRLIKPTRDNKGVTEPLIATANDFNCKVLENCMAYGMAKDIYDNAKTFVINPVDDMKKKIEKLDFDVNQVWTVSVGVSTGDAKVKEKETKTTIYKRCLASTYQLKMKTSRQFYSDVCNKYIGYPFNIRSFPDLSKAKIGVIECSKHGLIEPLPVTYEKDGEYVAYFKYTVLLTSNGCIRLTGLPFDANNYQSSLKVVNVEVKKLLSESIKNKKKVVSPPVAEN